MIECFHAGSAGSTRRRVLARLGQGVACGFGLGGLLPARSRAAEGEALGFNAWLAGFERAAVTAGIRRVTVARAFAGLTPIQHVIELDRRQPEVQLSYDAYIDKIVSDDRIDRGRQHFADNRDLLGAIGRRYGVDPAVIVALWGIETNYGTNIGSYGVVAALATLAWEGRRAQFFGTELIAALRILDTGRFRAAELRGSWAGAMGQTQFMPSSYLAYAVDYSGTGRADIWHDRADVFASIANYLRGSGWHAGAGWGLSLAPPIGLDPTYASALKTYMTGSTDRRMDAWSRIGLQQEDGRPLPATDTPAALVQPGGPGGPCLLVYPNFRAILLWNRSFYFATAVCLLADRIAG